jgi:hypothetical protein
MSSGIGGEKGIGKLTLLVFGGLVGSALYCSYYILPFYYYFYEMQNQMEQVIKIASTDTDEEIHKKLATFMKRIEIPAEPEDIRIERDGHNMKIALDYEEIFDVEFDGKVYYTRRFPFHARAEGDF